jgi:hypothetical protein
MLTDPELQRLADEHALSAYPFRWKATMHVQLDDPPLSYFGPAPPANIEGNLFGDGGFVVSRVNGEVCHFGSGQFIRASEAAQKIEGTHDLAVVVRYMATYSVDELRELAGYPRQGRYRTVLAKLFGRPRF